MPARLLFTAPARRGFPRFPGGLASPAAVLLVLLTCAAAAAAPTTAPFAIRAVDEATGRGVPLVELRTTSNVSFWTDSNGLVAIFDPGLMNQRVYFHVFSHGYEYPADGFGFRGTVLEVKPGGRATLPLKRINIAQRLYRITGEGIYHDSVILGHPVPSAAPVLNAQVTGQDSVQAAVYRGRIWWFWGDTNRLSYPLGHFGTAGATSDLPSAGGLDPSVGVNLNYFTDERGFSRPMCDLPGDGMKWIDGLMVVPDETGRQRLLAAYARMKSLDKCLERGLMVFDDDAGRFRRVAQFPVDTLLRPCGQAFTVQAEGETYIYFATALPVVRVKADFRSVTDLGLYEGFTCLRPGSRFDAGAPALDRDAAGRLVWAWKRATDPTGQAQQQQLISSGAMKPEEAWFAVRDVVSARPVRIHNGSVRYNAFRKRYVMIATEEGGASSFLGEVWYSEAQRPEGPWKWARKILTHDRYSFYNPVHHAFFDQQGGRVIYFEGTYSHTFSRQDQPTPRYDYNQIMYSLDLADPRLALPE